MSPHEKNIFLADFHLPKARAADYWVNTAADADGNRIKWAWLRSLAMQNSQAT
jgi:hypothetical protein